MLDFEIVPYWLREFLSENLWIVQVFIVVFLVVLVNFFVKRILYRLHHRLQATANIWDDALVEAMQRPLLLLIWIVGVAFAADIVRQQTQAVIFQAVAPIRDIGVIGAITWFLLRLVKSVETAAILRREAAGQMLDVSTVDAVSKLVRLSILITAALVAMQTLGYSISGILAFGGIGGVVVGLASRDLLANFFGALMIYLDRPFAIGEWIRSPDRDIEGIVEQIGWRLTVIRTFDKRLLYVPNATFTSIAVENPSRMTNRRIYETIGIRYSDVGKMGAIVDDVKQMLRAHPAIDTDATLMVNFNKFAASSIDFFVYAFTRTTKWAEYHEIKHDILLKISDIIAAHGAEVAFPTSTIHVPDGVAVHNGPAAADRH